MAGATSCLEERNIFIRKLNQDNKQKNKEIVLPQYVQEEKLVNKKIVVNNVSYKAIKQELANALIVLTDRNPTHVKLKKNNVERNLKRQDWLLVDIGQEIYHFILLILQY